MFESKRVAVVVPAFNEARAIDAMLATMPDFVDHIVVVNDASKDDTAAIVNGVDCSRVELISHHRNQGVGAAIVTGYQRALALGCDVVAVMAGDGQMDPADLPAVIGPVVRGEADYVKGNRFKHREIWKAMPATRLIGNVALSAATKLTSGYLHIFDSQCGYTAISASALLAIDLDGVFPRYGYPNDVLARLHVANMRVLDVPVRPIYGPHWKSGINFKTAFHPIPWVLLRSFGNRIAAEVRRPA
jgi:glycosyltransferase involved in cell wall biosynthesis